MIQINDQLSNETPPAFAKPMLPAAAVKKVKLSETQKKLIKQMRDGNQLHYIDGIDAKCFLHSGNGNISWATISKLENMNLIERGYRRVELTELGKNIQL